MNSESGYEDRGKKMCEELPILKGILNGNVKYHNARMCLEELINFHARKKDNFNVSNAQNLIRDLFDTNTI